MDWPLADLLAACRQKMKIEARENYRNETIVWAVFQSQSGKKINPPEVPAILKD